MDSLGYFFTAILLLAFPIWLGFEILLETIRWLFGGWSGQQEYFILEEKQPAPPEARKPAA